MLRQANAQAACSRCVEISNGFYIIVCLWVSITVNLIGIKKTVNSLPEIGCSYNYCMRLHAERFITDKV